MFCESQLRRSALLQDVALKASAFSPPCCNMPQNKAATILGMDKKLLRDALASNLRALMDRAQDLNTPHKLAKVCFWPKSALRAGEPISPRLISYMLNGAKGDHGPSLEAIEAVAEGLGVDPIALIAADDSSKVAAAYASLSPEGKEKVKDFLFMVAALESTSSGKGKSLLRKV